MGKFKKQAKGSSTSIKNKMKKKHDDNEASTDGKNTYLSAYKRAQLTFERLQAERKAETEKQRAERERQKEENDFNKEWRKKKNQALLLRTRKGQPNLNAQIGVLLEKLERDGGKMPEADEERNEQGNEMNKQMMKRQK